MRKKSQSELVSTVMLILFAIVAVVVIWLVVNYFLNFRNQDKMLCTDAKLTIVEARDNGIANKDTVTVTRLAGGNEEDVTGIKVLVNKNAVMIIQEGTTPCGHSYTDAGGTVITHPDCDLSFSQRQTKTFNISSDVHQGDFIEIAPIVGATEYVCRTTHSTRAV